MEKKTNTCKQCGERKQITEFRPLYNTAGYYNTCYECEAVNNRHKYLRRRQSQGKLTDKQAEEMRNIEKYYELLKARDLRPPAAPKRVNPVILDKIQKLEEASTNQLAEARLAGYEVDENTPEELLQWLTTSLDEYDDPEQLDDIHTELEDKYRPVTKRDDTGHPIEYDETYKSVLDAILNRFWEHDA